MEDDSDPKAFARKLLRDWARGLSEDDKKRMVKEMADGAGKIVQFAKDIKAGVSLDDALSKIGIDPVDFRRRAEERKRERGREKPEGEGD